MDKEPGRTRNAASRENRDTEVRQSFPMGSVDSTSVRIARAGSHGPSRPFNKFGVAAFNYLMNNPMYVSLNQDSSFRLGIL